MKRFTKGTAALLAGAMVFAFSPATALATVGPKAPGAADADGYQSGGASIAFGDHVIWTNNVYKDKDLDVDGYAGIAYDQTTNTLKLTNVVDGNEALYAVNVGDDFKIEVEGVNSVGNIDITNRGSYDETARKYVDYSSAVEFTGSGSLTVNQEKTWDSAVEVNGQGEGSDAGRVVVDQGVNVKFYNDDAKKDARRVLGHDDTEKSGHGVVSVKATGVSAAANAIQFKGLATQPEVTADDQGTAEPQAYVKYFYDLSDVDSSDIRTADYSYTRNGKAYVAFYSYSDYDYEYDEDDEDDNEIATETKYYDVYQVIGAPEGQEVKVYDSDSEDYDVSEATLKDRGATADTGKYLSDAYLNSEESRSIYQDANGASYVLVNQYRYNDEDGEYLNTKVYALQGLEEEEVTATSDDEWDAEWAVYTGTTVTRTENKDAYYDDDWQEYDSAYSYPGYTQLKKTYAQGFYNYDIAAETVEQGTVIAPATQTDYNDVKAQLDAANETLAAVQEKADYDAAALKSAQASVKAAEKALAKYASSITVNAKTVKASTVSSVAAKGVKTLTLGSKVVKVKSGALKDFTKLKTLVVKSTKLTKKSVKGAFKGNKLKKLTVKVPAKQLKKYKKAFTAKNLGVKKVTVKKV